MNTITLIGASVRAAAFSTLRMGWQPVCADLFADADLRVRCSAEQIIAAEYPRCFEKCLISAQACPWLYTGGLENYPTLIARWQDLRSLWGTEARILHRLRLPQWLHDVFVQEEVPCPQIVYPCAMPTGEKQWLLKPVRGSGGMRIRYWRAAGRLPRRANCWYLQEFIPGPSVSAVFVASASKVTLLGVTRQLVGETWLQAGPFSYCGSIGPLPLTDLARQRFLRIGTALCKHVPLRGLFGVDCLMRDELPFPVEVNPRYPASVEVLEYATGTSVLAAHCRAFDGKVETADDGQRKKTAAMVGKAILYAPARLQFPRVGPWNEDLCAGRDYWDLPTFADIPQPGTDIDAGHPIMTFFCHGDDENECLAKLMEIRQSLH